MEKILCVGGCVFDILVVSNTLPLIEHKNKKYFCIEYGSKTPGSLFIANEGGSATNVALNLNALGLNSALFATVGNDFLGNYIYENIRKTGINCKGIIKIDGVDTGIAFIVKSPLYPDRGMITVKGASDLLNKDHIDYNFINNYNYLVWCSLTSETSLTTILELIKIFKNRKVPGYIIAAPSSSMLKKFPAQSLEFIKKSNMYSSNLEEARIVLNCPDVSWIEAIRQILDLGIEFVSITNGDKGAIIGNNTELLKIEPLSINPVDTTGVGDAFLSGLIYGLVNKKDLEFSGKIATLMAYCVIQKYGTRKGVPNINKLNKLINILGPNIIIKRVE
ncbi:MAG: carbohydrate kinase family protein [Candidatus Helarchaeota archaeon]